MDPSSYKQVVTKRGINYNYYVSNCSSSKVTILLLHGFMSTARDWRMQVPDLEKAGYRVVAPDLMGYGGTDKPTDIELYKYSEMAADMIDILDAEKAGKTVAVGTDWGSALASRLANYHSERFIALVFLGVGYVEPATTFDLDAVLMYTKSIFGYELYGHWRTLIEEGADVLIQEHFDSFFSLLFPYNPELWKTDLGPSGALKSWLLADRKSPLPSYLTKEDKDLAAKGLLGGAGFAAILNWYKSAANGATCEDNKKVKKESMIINQPVFFAGAKKDYIGVAAVSMASMPASCPKLTVREYDGDHWIQLSHYEELNKDVLEWLSTVTV